MLQVQELPGVGPLERSFAQGVFTTKHRQPYLLFLAWAAFVSLVQLSPRARVTRVVGRGGAVLGLFVEFRTRGMHYFLTALVEHEAAKQHGIYVGGRTGAGAATP